MKLIVGLGNPGSEYEQTPHNIGFWAVREIAQALNASWKDEAKFKGKVARAQHQGETVWLLQPQTFMNLSGESVVPLMHYYNITPAELLVISDDCDLPAGSLRLRKSGSAGGHRGLLSIITLLGSQAFARLRLGVGRNKNQQSLVSFVIGKYTQERADQAKQTAATAAQAALCWLTDGPNEAMNRFNVRPDKEAN